MTPEDKAKLDALKDTVDRNESKLDKVEERQNSVLQKIEKLTGNGELSYIKKDIGDIRAEQAEHRRQIVGLDRTLNRWGGGIAAISGISVLIAILRLIFQK